MTVPHDDGTEAEVSPGRANVIEAGHDAWVVWKRAVPIGYTGRGCGRTTGSDGRRRGCELRRVLSAGERWMEWALAIVFQAGARASGTCFPGASAVALACGRGVRDEAETHAKDRR